MKTHEEIKKFFIEITECFSKIFGKPENKKLPFQVKEHEWLNYFYSSPLFRHIHLEYYKTNKICVMHVNTFADPRVDLPILGFDMIALGDKITGLFFDYTPTFTTFAKFEYDLDRISLKYKSEKRSLPEWANFFSSRFYCVSPISAELPNMLQDIKSSIVGYLELCRDEGLKCSLRTDKQNAYCVGQKKNDKTSKALAAEIGEKNAKQFLNKYLFPEIKK